MAFMVALVVFLQSRFDGGFVVYLYCVYIFWFLSEKVGGMVIHDI